MWLVVLCDHWRAFHKQEEVVHLHPFLEERLHSTTHASAGLVLLRQLLQWHQDRGPQETYFANDAQECWGHTLCTNEQWTDSYWKAVCSLVFWSILAHIPWVVPAVGRFPWRYQSEWIAFFLISEPITFNTFLLRHSVMFPASSCSFGVDWSVL